ncbi:MAG TPA: tetraacyldisaccharide 4'-kinase [Nitrospiraceae bacterium]|nr:tetraacyldisaccharide 4'-kinase [Nitrospiraceae bacterium]
MYGRRSSVLLSPILLFLSLLYGIVILLRRFFYASGLFQARKLPVTVISVGNITLGGTGKTPAVISIANLLRDNDRFPAVVSRGYGRQSDSAILIASDGDSLVSNTAQSGDEPALMGAKLPGVPVIVGRNRYEAGLYAHQVFGPDTVVLDDGFQHRGLCRDLDIVLIDATDPFGNGRLFPAGILREPLSALRRAGAVVITRSEGIADLGPLRDSIGHYTTAPLFTAVYRAVSLFDVNGEDVRPVSALRDLPVLIFSGIARPGPFKDLLTSLGARIKAEMVYPDHHAYTNQDLAAIFHTAGNAGATMIVTTEKDSVKLQQFQAEGIWALGIELRIAERDAWENLILRQRA